MKLSSCALLLLVRLAGRSFAGRLRSSRLRKSHGKLQPNPCGVDSSSFCPGEWREQGAYSEQDCDQDGMADLICDTYGSDDSIWANKRWIFLSSDCDKYSSPDEGNAPPCEQVMVATDSIEPYEAIVPAQQPSTAQRTTATSATSTVSVSKDTVGDNPCGVDSSKFCVGVWRDMGAYSEQDCDRDGKMDFICDTHGINDEKWGGMRWIVLSSDCPRYSRAGTAPSCEAIKAGVDAAARQDDWQTAPVIIAPGEDLPTGTPEKCMSIQNPCNASSVFMPSNDCAGAASGSCSADQCCMPKATCGDAAGAASLSSTGFCTEEKLFVATNRCSGRHSSSCSPAECCVPKETCASIGTSNPCSTDQTFIASRRCAGTTRSSCDASACCVPLQNCSSQHHLLRCDRNTVFEPSNLCFGPKCEIAECCVEKELCSSIKSPCFGNHIFVPEQRCTSSKEESCTADVCCVPPAKCSSVPSMCSGDEVLMSDNSCGGLTSASCTKEYCCHPRARCASIEDPCDGSGKVFVQSAQCAGAEPDSCTEAQCCM